MTDRELLELAAKADGRKWFHYSSGYGKGLCCKSDGMSVEYYWNPLDDDGDALRLAVKLDIGIHPDEEIATTCTSFSIGGAGYNTCEEWGPMRDGSKDDPYAATRRAIVRAAAEIGKEMK